MTAVIASLAADWHHSAPKVGFAIIWLGLANTSPVDNGESEEWKEATMQCPNCERELPLLAAALAQTEMGTQCPSCWPLLHGLRARALGVSRKMPERSVQLNRRAA